MQSIVCISILLYVDFFLVIYKKCILNFLKTEIDILIN